MTRLLIRQQEVKQVNCIIATIVNGSIDIYIQEDSIKAANFSSFFEGIVHKLRLPDDYVDSNIVLVYDNASIHVCKLIKETIGRIK